MRRTARIADGGPRSPRDAGRLRWPCLLLGLLCAACLRATAFECEGDDECVRNGAPGRCEDQGVCSYPSDSCESGRAYSPNAGALAGACVPVAGATSTATSGEPTSSEPTSIVTCGEASTTDDCGPCVSVEVGSRSFLACAESLSFSDADAACSMRGLTLASIHSDAENDAVGELVAWPDAYWIGLNDRDLEQQWRWTDGSAVGYFAWGPGQPDDIDSVEDCVSTTEPGTWSVQRCGLPNRYVCATLP